MTKSTKNTFWAVYDKKGKVVSISKDKIGAQEEALKLSGHRWVYQTFREDWGYLLEDGYKLLKSEIKPLIKNSSKKSDNSFFGSGTATAVDTKFGKSYI